MLTWILYLVIKIHHSIDIPIYSLLLYYRDIFELLFVKRSIVRSRLPHCPLSRYNERGCRISLANELQQFLIGYNPIFIDTQHMKGVKHTNLALVAPRIQKNLHAEDLDWLTKIGRDFDNCMWMVLSPVLDNKVIFLGVKNDVKFEVPRGTFDRFTKAIRFPGETQLCYQGKGIFTVHTQED